MLFITSMSELAQLKFALREQTLQAAVFGMVSNRLSALTDTLSNSLLCWTALIFPSFSLAAPEPAPACQHSSSLTWKYHTKAGRRGSLLCAEPLY